MSQAMSTERSGHKCREHPNANVIEDYRTSDCICRECGLVVGRTVEMEGEWRTFSGGREKKDQSRVGGPTNPLLKGTDLGTAIADGSHGRRRAAGRGKHSKQIKGDDRHLIHGFALIVRMGEAVKASKNAVMRAQNILKDSLEKPIFKNKSSEAMAAASLYVACRIEGIFVLYKPLCREAKIKKLEVGKCYKLIVKELHINLAVVTCTTYVEPLCNQLDLPTRLRNVADIIAETAVASDIVAGRSPLAVAAAAIYMVSQASGPEFKRSRQEIASKADLAGVTVAVTYKQMLPAAEKIFPLDFQFYTPIDELPMS